MAIDLECGCRKGPPKDTVLKCNWCSSGLVVRDGAWEWDRDAY